MRVYFGVALLLILSACSTNIIVPEEQRRGVAQSPSEKVELREMDELRWQMEIYKNGGPKTHNDIKEILKSTASSNERIAMMRALECDPVTRTVSIENPAATLSTDPCYFSGLPQWNLYSWSRFNLRKIPTSRDQFKTMVIAYDVESYGSPEEIYEVTLSDKRRALIMNTSFPKKAMFPQDEQAWKKVIVRNGRVLLLKQANPTQFKVDGEILAYKFIPDSF